MRATSAAGRRRHRQIHRASHATRSNATTVSEVLVTFELSSVLNLLRCISVRSPSSAIVLLNLIHIEPS